MAKPVPATLDKYVADAAEAIHSFRYGSPGDLTESDVDFAGAAVEAVYPGIAAEARRDAERACAERYRVSQERMAGLIAQAVKDERTKLLTVLVDHYLMSVECDPVNKLDNPVCGCSRVFLGWHPSIGAARQAWIDHVADLLGGES